MKKILSIVATILILCICFASCDSSSNNEKESTDNTTTESRNDETTESNNNTTKEPSKVEVNNIFLSKSTVTLGVGETLSLIATISPSNASNKLTWSSSDAKIVSVDNKGRLTAKSEGEAVIKVVADNGIVAVCNVTVKVKTGSVTGNITYKYNNYVGNRPDTGSVVFLISKDVKSLPDSIARGWTFDVDQCDGVYATEVDGSGNYTLNDIPVGEYYIVIISDNTNSGSTSGAAYWIVYHLFSTEGKSLADNTCRMHKITSSTITIQEEKNITFSHDFGITAY